MKYFNCFLTNHIKALVFSLKEKTQGKELVFLCIGNEKYTFDSFGPIVGELLKTKYNIPYKVFGSVGYNITRKNLKVVINNIKADNPNSYIVAIDACVGDSEFVGLLKLSSCVLASGLSNEPIRAGDVGLNAIVGAKGLNNIITLSHLKHKNIKTMAEIVADAVYCACTK